METTLLNERCEWDQTSKIRKFYSKVFIKVYYIAGMWEEDRRQSFTQSCLTLQSTDCSLPGSSIHGTLQARILEWVAIPLFRGSSQPRDQTWVSHIAGKFLLCEPPGKPWNVRIIIYWWSCNCNAAAWMQVTEPWRICWAFVWRGSFLENFLSFVSCFLLPHFFEFPHPSMKYFWLLTCCWFEYLMQNYFVYLPSFYKLILLRAETLDF